MKAERPGLACPRRKKAPVRRRAARVRVQQNMFCTQEFFSFFSEKLKGLTAHEKLLMFYMMVTEQLGEVRLHEMPAVEFCEGAGYFLHMPHAKMMRAFFGLAKKGIVTNPNFPDLNQAQEKSATAPQEENNG